MSLLRVDYIEPLGGTSGTLTLSSNVELSGSLTVGGTQFIDGVVTCGAATGSTLRYGLHNTASSVYSSVVGGGLNSVGFNNTFPLYCTDPNTGTLYLNNNVSSTITTGCCVSYYNFCDRTIYSGVVTCSTWSGDYTEILGICPGSASGYYSVLRLEDGIYGDCYSQGSTVSGGVGNTAVGSYSFVGGGYRNTASSYYATVSGGYRNTASNRSATVSGGYRNTASYGSATVSGGCCNTASGYKSFIGGGEKNTADGRYAIIVGGFCNTSSNTYLCFGSFVGGGSFNNASGDISTIVAGAGNNASGRASLIVAGGINHATACASTVINGLFNTASNLYSTILNGCCNIANGIFSTIISGTNNNICEHNRSIILGSDITANRSCTAFVNNLSIMNIPTSSAGLPPGSIWSDGGTLKIVS
jgi:hypothetical protein